MSYFIPGTRISVHNNIIYKFWNFTSVLNYFTRLLLLRVIKIIYCILSNTYWMALDVEETQWKAVYKSLLVPVYLWKAAHNTCYFLQDVIAHSGRYNLRHAVPSLHGCIWHRWRRLMTFVATTGKTGKCLWLKLEIIRSWKWNCVENTENISINLQLLRIIINIISVECHTNFIQLFHVVFLEVFWLRFWFAGVYEFQDSLCNSDGASVLLYFTFQTSFHCFPLTMQVKEMAT